MIDPIDFLVLPNETTTSLEELDLLLEDIHPDLRPILEAFRFNLSSVSTIISLPYHLTHHALALEEQATLREEIRALLSQSHPEKSLLDRIELMDADLRNKIEEINSSRIPQLRQKAQYKAKEAITHPEIAPGVYDLFFYSLLLTWSAIEVVANDTFITVLNNRGKLAQRIFDEKASQKHFQAFKVDIEVLVENDFNLQNRMGKLLARSAPLDSTEDIKKVFSALFPNHSVLLSAISSGELRTLYLQRNLIAHCRGIVDEHYIARSGRTETPLGERLKVGVTEIQNAMVVAKQFGSALLSAADLTLRESID